MAPQRTWELNTSVGNANVLGGIRLVHIIWFGLPLTIFPLLGLMEVASPSVSLFLTAFFFVAGIMIAISSPHRFLAQLPILNRKINFITIGQRNREGTKFIPDTKLPRIVSFRQTGRKPRKQTKKDKRRRERPLAPMELESDLIVTCNIKTAQGDVGSYLLKAKKGGLYCLFGWKLSGTNPAISPTDTLRYAEGIDKGLRKIEPGAYFTIINEAFPGELTEVDELLALKTSEQSPLEQQLLDSQVELIKELDTLGQRRTKELHAFLLMPCSIPPEAGLLAELLEWFVTRYNAFSGKQLSSPAALRRQILNAYQRGFVGINGELAKNFRQKAKVLDAEALTRIDYRETHSLLERQYMPPPLLITREAIKRKKTDNPYACNAYLFAGENGRSTNPVDMDSYVYLPGKRKYCAVMVIGKAKAYSHEYGWTYGATHYLTDVLDDANIAHYKIVTQFGGCSSAWQNFLIAREGNSGRGRLKDKIRRGESTVKAGIDLEKSEEAEADIAEGKKVLTLSTLIFVYEDDPHELEYACQRLAQAVPSTTPCEREMYMAYRYWKEARGWSAEPMLKAPFYRMDRLMTGDALGYFPAILPRAFDQRGLHFLTRRGMSPLHLDFFDRNTLPKHCILYAEPRSGKSVMLADAMLRFLLANIPAVAFDFPDPEGNSTYSDYVRLLKQLGANVEYYDVSRESFNYLEIPASGHFEISKEFQGRAIKQLVLGLEQDPKLIADAGGFIERSLTYFQQQPHIIARYEAAWEQGWGSQAYQNQPTLFDYLDCYDQWAADYKQEYADALDERTLEALRIIPRTLRGLLDNDKLRRAIAEPSTIDPSAKLLVIALTEVKDPVQAAIFALAGYQAVVRQRILNGRCGFIADELPILFKIPAIVDLTSDFCSNGQKWGIYVLMATQFAEAILNVPQGDQIISTVQVNIAGRIKGRALDGLVQTGNFTAEILKPYASGERKPDPDLLMSSWVITESGQQVEALYRPSNLLFALVANSPQEADARHRIMAQYNDPIAGLKAFADLFPAALRGDITWDKVGLEPAISTQS